MIFTRVTVRLILRIARTGWRSSSTDEIKSTPNVSFTHTIVCGVEHTQTQDSHVYDCIMFVKLIALALCLPRLVKDISQELFYSDPVFNGSNAVFLMVKVNLSQLFIMNTLLNVQDRIRNFSFDSWVLYSFVMYNNIFNLRISFFC